MARCHLFLCRVRQRLDLPRRVTWLAVPTRVLFATLRNNKSSRRWRRRDGIAARPQRCWAFHRQRCIADYVITIWKDDCEVESFVPSALGEGGRKTKKAAERIRGFFFLTNHEGPFSPDRIQRRCRRLGSKP